MPFATMIETPEAISAITRCERGERKSRPTIANEEEDGGNSEDQIRIEREESNVRDDRAVEGQADREQRQHLGFAAVGEPNDISSPTQEQRAAENGAFNDLQSRYVISGVGGEVDGCQAAGKEHLRVILERFLFAVEPGAQGKQGTAEQVKQSEFSGRAEMPDEILVGVSAKENDARQQHDDADANKPIGAESHFK